MSSRREMQGNKDHPGRGLAVDIISSIDGNAMLDIMIIANDGGEIPASRFVLGARSPVLQQLLFSKNKTPSSELKLNYSTTVIESLVHYCRTNELKNTGQPMDEDSAREAVKVCKCAAEFQLKDLVLLVGNLASSACQSNPQLACAIYDEATVQGKSVDSLKEIAVGFIRKNPEGTLLRMNEFGSGHTPGGVSYLQAASLEELLGDTALNTEEINLFRAIVAWCDASSPAVDVKLQRKMDSWATQLLQNERREAARKITTKCIDLSKIAPSDLVGMVSESGLVDQVQITDALVQLALRVEKEGVDVSKTRSGGRKKRSPPPHPPVPPPPEIEYHRGDDDDSDSFTEILGQIGTNNANTSGSSVTYEHAEQSNKRKPVKQEPKAVTPQKKPEPKFVTPERQRALPSTPERLSQDSSSVSRPKPSKTTKKKSPRSFGSEIRKAVGIYLRDKVDSMCIHPKSRDDDADSDH